jgi:TetR/AcrR family fatty acid metabolism transcriptional regulator
VIVHSAENSKQQTANSKQQTANNSQHAKMRSARTLNSDRPVVVDKREAILRAAIRVFAHNGYFNSKVADIASEAGVADGTVYLYFKSKEEILN